MRAQGDARAETADVPTRVLVDHEKNRMEEVPELTVRIDFEGVAAAEADQGIPAPLVVHDEDAPDLRRDRSRTGRE